MTRVLQSRAPMSICSPPTRRKPPHSTTASPRDGRGRDCASSRIPIRPSPRWPCNPCAVSVWRQPSATAVSTRRRRRSAPMSWRTPGTRGRSRAAAAFYVALPDAATGACPANTRAGLSFREHGRSDAAAVHGGGRRARLDHSARRMDAGRIGPAPDRVAMCAPTAGPSTIGPPQTGRNYEGLWWPRPPGRNRVGGCPSPSRATLCSLAWFTYDAEGKPWWLSMTANKTAPDSYSGLLVQTSGPPFNAVPFDPNEVVRTPVGAATLTFRNGDSGTFSYAVAGAAQSKAITRFMFGPCRPARYEAHPDLLGGDELSGCLVCAGRSGVRLGSHVDPPGRWDLRRVVHLR